MVSLGGNMGRKKYLDPNTRGMVGSGIDIIAKIITRLHQCNLYQGYRVF